MNAGGRFIANGPLSAFTCRIRPFKDRLDIEVPWLFYPADEPYTPGYPTPFVDRFWDDRENWISPGIGVVENSLRPYFGPIPAPGTMPLVGTADQWENGLSYADWQADGFQPTAPCASVTEGGQVGKIAQRQSFGEFRTSDYQGCSSCVLGAYESYLLAVTGVQDGICPASDVNGTWTLVEASGALPPDPCGWVGGPLASCAGVVTEFRLGIGGAATIVQLRRFNPPHTVYVLYRFLGAWNCLSPLRLTRVSSDGKYDWSAATVTIFPPEAP